MKKTYLFTAYLLGCMACDGSDEVALGSPDDPRLVFLAEVVGEPEAGDVLEIHLDAPEELEVEADWSTFDLASATQPVEAPGGQTCCVNCADGWSGWWNRGNGDGCYARGAKWCHDHNWNIVDAQWWAHCPTG